LEQLSPGNVKRLFRAIEALAGQPYPPGCRKLKGQVGFWRIRVGVYRVIYEVEPSSSLVRIVLVRHRKDAYR
jgi:mRNA interferase RelE/StbE